jgi:hypothetical protein
VETPEQNNQDSAAPLGAVVHEGVAAVAAPSSSITPEQEAAAVKIQAQARGMIVRKASKVRHPNLPHTSHICFLFCDSGFCSTFGPSTDASYTAMVVYCCRCRCCCCC